MNDMNLRVVVAVKLPSRNAKQWSWHFAVCCSIECARHHGYEPVRLPIGDEADEPCVFCGENEAFA